MSLEEALNKNTAAMEKQNDLLSQLLSKSVAAPAAEPKAETSSAASVVAEKTADAPAANSGPTTASVLAKFTTWMNEFEKGHAEKTARTAKLKELLTKLGETKISEVKDADKLAKLDKWMEDKGKADGAFVRLAPDADTAAAEEEL